MIKILIVIANKRMEVGGTESYLANVLEHVDRSQLQIDIFIPGKIEAPPMALRLERCGCKIYAQGLDNHAIWDVHTGIRLYHFLKTHNYDIIHVNSVSIRMQIPALLAARLRGTKIRIAHSHTAAIASGRLKECVRDVLRKITRTSATALAACSEDAARWMFGERAAVKAVIARNGIDTEKFAFCKDVRDEYRQRLGVENCLVLGHVGRFAEEKNHRFLIEIFRQIVKREPSARLLLIGSGLLESEIRLLANEYRLNEKVIFVGAVDIVEKYMCAMDLFVLPSLYEGLGMVNIEAQASGLPCIVSDTVPEEAKLTELLEFEPLASGAEAWADKILQRWSGGCHVNREDAWIAVRKAGYDISDTARVVQELYQIADKPTD